MGKAGLTKAIAQGIFLVPVLYAPRTEQVPVLKREIPNGNCIVPFSAMNSSIRHRLNRLYRTTIAF